MKEIIISKARIKIELITILVCFIIAFFTNLGAILYFKTSFIELITSIGFVIAFAIFLYVLWSIIRLIGYGIKIMFSKK